MEEQESNFSEILLETKENVLVGKLKAFLKLKNLKEEQEKALKQIQKIYATTEEKLFDLMFDLDVQSIEIEDKKVYRKVSQYPKIINQEDFFQWLRDNGYAELIKETVNTQTLGSWYREYISDHEESNFEEMLDIFEKKGLGVRKT